MNSKLGRTFHKVTINSVAVNLFAEQPCRRDCLLFLTAERVCRIFSNEGAGRAYSGSEWEFRWTKPPSRWRSPNLLKYRIKILWDVYWNDFYPVEQPFARALLSWGCQASLIRLSKPASHLNATDSPFINSFFFLIFIIQFLECCPWAHYYLFGIWGIQKSGR